MRLYFLPQSYICLENVKHLKAPEILSWCITWYCMRIKNEIHRNKSSTEIKDFNEVGFTCTVTYYFIQN